LLVCLKWYCEPKSVLIMIVQAPSYPPSSPRRTLLFTSHLKTLTSHTFTSTYLVSLESSSECFATICPVSVASGRWFSQVLPWEPVCSSSSPSTARPVTSESTRWSTSSKACSMLFYTVSHEMSSLDMLPCPNILQASHQRLLMHPSEVQHVVSAVPSDVWRASFLL